jgi:light-harvesting complex 1 beta chain
MATEVEKRASSLSGMTEPEAREFHRIFMTSFIVFVVIAIVAHFLAWQWRPWLPDETGYTTSSLLDAVRAAAAHVTSQLA